VTQVRAGQVRAVSDSSHFHAPPPSSNGREFARFISWDKPGPNLDVIEAAAERQTVFLRTFQIGHQAELAERILNEIASAQVTLLNVDQKLAYDAALRQQRTETEQQAQTAEPHSRESFDPFGAPTQVL
jgi:hypothetical protein